MIARRAGVGGVILLAHGDEPVGFAVVAQRDGLGIQLLQLGANLLHLVPGGRHGDAVGVKEGLIVVEHFGRLGEGHGVHQTVAILAAFIIIALDEVGLLLVGQAQDLGAAIRAGDGDGAVNQRVQRLHGLGQVVQGHMVGIAVGNVGLSADGDIGDDLIAHAVVIAQGSMLDVDVGIELIELSDVGIEHALQGAALLGVEANGHLAAVVALCGHLKTGGKGRAAQQHQHQDDG